MTKPGSRTRTLNSWREAWRLARQFRRPYLTGVLVVALGLAAAMAEVVGIGVAVMLLFSMTGQVARLQGEEGILGQVHAVVTSAFGADTAVLSAIFAGIVLLSAVLSYTNNAVTGMILNRVAERMRDVIHERYLGVGFIYLQRVDHGTLMHTLANESWTVADAFYGLARIVVNLAAVAVFGAGLFALSWQLGVTALAGAIGAFLLLRLVAWPVQRLGARTLEANQTLSERMLIPLRGMRTLRILTLEPVLRRRFETASARVRRRAVRTELVKAIIGPLNQLWGIGLLVLMVIVGRMTDVDVATTVAAVMILFRLQPYLLDMEEHRVALANMTAPLRAVADAIETSGKPWPRQGGRAFDGLAHEIRFEEVSFTHDARKGATIDGLSFTIRKGRRTALLGPSGSGKSTVINLLLRLYEPQGGRITVDGVDLGELTRESWLGRLGIAGQDVELFHGTILDNLTLGAPDLDEDAVRDACRFVELLEDLEELPDGLATGLGAGGLSLSGGQRQRLGLARALLRDPEILLLDEAMNSIEPAMEDRILDRLARRFEGRTLVFVSHRRDAAAWADEVIRLHHGRIVDAAAIA